MTPDKTLGRCLVVDDEQAILDEYVRALSQGTRKNRVVVALSELRTELFASDVVKTRKATFDVDTCLQGDAAVARVQAAKEQGRPYAALFLDMQMPPGINGAETAKRIRQIDPYVNIVIVTGSSFAEPEVLARDIQPIERLFFFQKPFHANEFRQLAIALCAKWHSDRELRRTNARLEDHVRQRTTELHELAFYDPVTGLANRQKSLSDLEEMVALSNINSTKLAVVLFDIERFSFVNATMGYEFGTKLLKEVSFRLGRTLRDTDVAGRFGADEFACLIGSFDDADLPKIVERVRSIFVQPFSFQERKIYAKCSMGVAIYPDHGDDSEAVFRCAEAALHQSKQNIIRETTYYDTKMGALALRRFQLESELREAIEKEHIQPYFQPQISLTTGKVTSVEVLARWIKPCGEIVPPSSFVPVIEETGLSDMLFFSMLRQSAFCVTDWRGRIGYEGAFSINISGHQVRNDKLVFLIDQILQQNELDPAALKLELTETVLLSDFETAERWLAQIVEFGIEVQIDDFGTGYSSLKYLAELPCSVLKIDRSFLDRISESQTQQRLVSGIIALGHALGVTVTAEGIETEEHLQLMRDYHCDVAQGYLIAKPMPAADFQGWFAGRPPLAVTG